MRGFNVFLYSVKQGMKSLKKNRMFTLASVGTVAACLFLFGLFYFVLSNFQHIIHSAETSVGLTVFFDDGISVEQIDSIGTGIRERDEVDHVDFVSADQAWEDFKADNFEGSPELVESFGEDNPLADSASYAIYLRDIERQDTLVEYLESVEGIRSIKKSDEVAKNFASVNRLVTAVSSVLILVLVLVSVFLIHSTIATGIAVRRREIAIMRLMGASDYFIWAPFIVEGVVIGLIGSMIPLAVLAFAYGRIIDYIISHFSLFSENLSFLTAGGVFSVLVPVGLFLGVGIGFLGSYITVRRSLNV